jgi:hypothetical protein
MVISRAQQERVRRLVKNAASVAISFPPLGEDAACDFAADIRIVGLVSRNYRGKLRPLADKGPPHRRGLSLVTRDCSGGNMPFCILYFTLLNVPEPS